MSDLTPIPAEQRAAYYDALLAGRAEAERLGYPLLDDRIFGAFWAAIRSGYTPLIEAATAERIADALLARSETPTGAGDQIAWSVYRDAAAIAWKHAKETS